MGNASRLEAAAARLAAQLAAREVKIVFAESCTGGLVSATLTAIPGISAFHCGSAVVYRSETKAAWLGVSAEMLAGPGPVSAEVTVELAGRVLDRTPEADLALAITGHLGPDAPDELDGTVYVAAARRAEPAADAASPAALRHRLTAEDVESAAERGDSQRVGRQKAAAAAALEFAAGLLS